MTRLSLIGVLTGICLTAAAAEANETARAEDLFRQGREAMARRELGQACRLFAESWQLEPAPGTLLNLADCHEKLGKLATAMQDWTSIVKILPAADERAVIARARLTALGPRVPRVTFRRSPASPEDVRVASEDQKVGPVKMNEPIALDPGEHSFVVTASGHAPRRISVAMVGGTGKELQVMPGESTIISTPPALVDRAPDGSHPINWRTTGWIVGGVGAGALLVGTVTGAVALIKKSEADEQCNAQRFCNSDGLRAIDQGKTFSTISTVSFVVGGLALATGGAMLIFGPRPDKESVSIAPATIASGYGLAVGGQFR